MIIKEISDHRLTKLVSISGGCNIDKGPWIAGGAARRLWFGEDWTKQDVDLWFPDPLSFERAGKKLESWVKGSVVADHAPVDPFDVKISLSPKSSEPIYITKNANTYKVQVSSVFPDVVSVQAIKRAWYENLDSIFNYFDFTSCKFATDGKVIVADPDAIDHCQRKLLIINPKQAETARISAKRVAKYGLYGFRAEPDIMRELLRQRSTGEIHNDTDAADYA